MNTKLLSEIEKFMSEAKLGPHRFGLLAAKNGRLVDRLREGRRVWPETEKQVLAYIAAERRKSSKAKQPEAAQ